jgi:hypothetical protein
MSRHRMLLEVMEHNHCWETSKVLWALGVHQEEDDPQLYQKDDHNTRDQRALMATLAPQKLDLPCT